MIELKVDRMKIENGFRMTFVKTCVRIPRLISSVNTIHDTLGEFIEAKRSELHSMGDSQKHR